MNPLMGQIQDEQLKRQMQQYAMMQMGMGMLQGGGWQRNPLTMGQIMGGAAQQALAGVDDMTNQALALQAQRAEQASRLQQQRFENNLAMRAQHSREREIQRQAEQWQAQFGREGEQWAAEYGLDKRRTEAAIDAQLRSLGIDEARLGLEGKKLSLEEKTQLLAQQAQQFEMETARRQREALERFPQNPMSPADVARGMYEYGVGSGDMDAITGAVGMVTPAQTNPLSPGERQVQLAQELYPDDKQRQFDALQKSMDPLERMIAESMGYGVGMNPMTGGSGPSSTRPPMPNEGVSAQRGNPRTQEIAPEDMALLKARPNDHQVRARIQQKYGFIPEIEEEKSKWSWLPFVD